MFFPICNIKRYSGGYSSGVPPLPIPNREVKPVHADGTAHPWEVKPVHADGTAHPWEGR